MTVKQAARLLGVSTDMVGKMLRSGKLEFVTINARDRRILLESVYRLRPPAGLLERLDPDPGSENVVIDQRLEPMPMGVYYHGGYSGRRDLRWTYRPPGHPQRVTRELARDAQFEMERELRRLAGDEIVDDDADMGSRVPEEMKNV